MHSGSHTIEQLRVPMEALIDHVHPTAGAIAGYPAQGRNERSAADRQHVPAQDMSCPYRSL
jgi:hypothetical protein